MANPVHCELVRAAHVQSVVHFPHELPGSAGPAGGKCPTPKNARVPLVPFFVPVIGDTECSAHSGTPPDAEDKGLRQGSSEVGLVKAET